MATNPYDPMSPMQNEVTHNQRMADVMRMHSLQPIQNVGASPLSEVSPFQGLAQVMGAYASNKMQDRATQGQADLVKAMQAHTDHGVDQYLQDYQNDPRAAVMAALKNPSPVVRAMATQELKGLMTPKTMAAHATDASVIGSNGNTGQFQAKNKLTTVEPGKPLMNEQGNLVVPQIQPGAGQTLETINGDLYGRTPTGVDQINKAPRVNTAVSINTPQKAGMNAYFTNAAKQVDELGAKANTSTQLLRTLDELKTMDAKGVYSNVTSPAAVFMSNLAQAAGVPVTQELKNKLGNTESYNAASNDLWQSIVAKYGGNRGVTEKEAEQIKKSLPLVTYSPEARNLITDILGRAASRQIQDYHTANGAFAEAAQTEDPSKFSNIMKDIYTPNREDTKVPANAQINQQGNAPPKFEDLLKQRGILK